MKVNKSLLRVLAMLILGVAILSMFQERLSIRIDGNTVTLIGLSVILFILPELTNVSKLKFANIEVEFQKKITQLEKDVAMAEANAPKSATVKESHEIGHKSYESDYNDIIRNSSSNTEKIRRASQLMENIMRENPQTVDPLIFTRFQDLTRQVLQHDEKNISDGLTDILLDMLWRILKVVERW